MLVVDEVGLTVGSVVVVIGVLVASGAVVVAVLVGLLPTRQTSLQGT